ncbi:MAG: hypothetical protein MUO94_06130, partial [Thermoplasmata archaeon]|nr:hypothetical protein [Thermoplasmata archaeon]
MEGAKSGLAAVDEKTIEELGRRQTELDDSYLKLSEREGTLRGDEKRLEEEWTRLHSIEEELAQLAHILKDREEQFRQTAPDEEQQQ